MKGFALFLQLTFVLSTSVSAAPAEVLNPLIAPGTLTDQSVTLLWNKQYAKDTVVYEILLNGKPVGSTGKTNFTISHLLPAIAYSVAVRVKQNKGVKPIESKKLAFKTATAGKVYNILDFGAKDDTAFKNTKAIQAAIDACTSGGTVYIPKGTFLSGELFLKSNMTLYIEKDAVLKGSVTPEDYLPMILNRFEGWEMKTYASLLNAGSLNRNGTYNGKNLRITGGGTISGGGRKLGDAIVKIAGLRGRGRLILLMNCQNVSISNVTITEPPC